MRAVMISVFSVQFFASVGYFLTQDQSRPPVAAQLEFETPELKPVPQPCGTEWRASVVCRNKGTVPLRLLEVGKSCGCTDVSLPDKRLLDPGETAEIQVGVRVGTSPGEKSNVEVLCQFEATESRLKGLARLNIQFSSECDTPTVVPLPQPIPDPAFGGTDAQEP